MNTTASCISKSLSFIALLIGLFIHSSYAQDITGQWNSLLKVPGASLRLVIHIEENAQGDLNIQMDSPDQKAFGIPTTSASFQNGKLKFNIASMSLEYSGNYNTETKTIEGTFKQGGQSFPLNFNREEIKNEAPNRPQEPKEPFPYYVEELTFPNDLADITLAGTLTRPKKEGRFPVVIMITGSGAQDRNEEILGHKPFLVIADHLTRNGIAVLRYDDRGFGESTGDFSASTTKDFATDAESAIAYLKTRNDIDTSNIGLIGHSEGGIIAPMVASKLANDVAFIVLLAAPAVSGKEILLLQQKLISKASGVSEDIISKRMSKNRGVYELINSSSDMSDAALKQSLNAYMKSTLTEEDYPAKMDKEDFLNSQVNSIINPWFRFFFKYDPSEALKKLECPVFALNGEKDLQVDAAQNLNLIQQIFKDTGKENYKAQKYEQLNHLFQESATGLPSEYGNIEQTISPVVLEEITTWLKAQIGI